MTYPFSPNPIRFGTDPNIAIGQQANARMQALRSRLASMQEQDSVIGSRLGNAYQKQFQRKQQEELERRKREAEEAARRQSVPQGRVRRYYEPPGQAPQGQLGDWINQALGILKMGSEYAPGIAHMIKKESSGNPRAINKWDSNWKRGTPSMGLMQTIQPTFNRWALPGYNTNVYDPVSNIIAGVRYAQNRYGNNMLRSGGRRNNSGNYIGY